MLKIFIAVICILFGTLETMYAQYNIADTNYINATIVLKRSNDSSALAYIQKYKLDPNYLFHFPKDSLFIKTSSSSSSSSSDYSSSSSAFSSPHNIGGAIAGIISAPFIALGKILGSIGRHRSNSSTTVVKVDTMPKIIQVYETNLLEEMLGAKYYGKDGKIYKTLIETNPINPSTIDSLLHKKAKYQMNNLIALACYTSDTNLLALLESKKLFDVDSSFLISDITLIKPILLASNFDNFTLMQFLIHRNANPLVKSIYYKRYRFSLGLNSGISFDYHLPDKKRKFDEYSPLQLTQNKEMKKLLKSYIKTYKKQKVNT